MGSIVLLFLSLFVIGCSANGGKDWWKHSQLYQIYPRSFMDSDGDGIGDIKGITSKIPHLYDIGVEAVWLSPVFESPMLDFGYDISNFTKIQEEYGTEADLRELLREAKRYGIRVLLDFVPNHTSDQCEWFQLSANRTPGYENYYVWHPGYPNPTVGGPQLPPSNWISVFRRSAWTFHPVRGEFYLHQFLSVQPDLNYREPKVVEEMKNILRYWLDIGVDGFRVDAIPHLVEEYYNINNTFPDEPLSGLTNDTEDYNYLDHIYTREREETWTAIFGWRSTVDEYSGLLDTKIIVMEAFSEIDIVMQYYGNSTFPGAHYPFNFDLIGVDSTANAFTLKMLIDTYMQSLPVGSVSNWVVGNHDRPRLASRVGNLADGIMMMNMLLPGVSVTYQGEEIGMVDQPLSFNDTQDPQACLSGEELYNITSRDPQRTPFQWDATLNAGFSNTTNKTWLPVADNYMELNLFNQKIAPKSTYKLYRRLSALRRSNVIKYGGMRMEVVDNDVLVFTRYYQGEVPIVVVINTANTIKNAINLNVKFEDLVGNLEVLVPSVNSNWNAGEILSVKSLELKPYESLVLKSGAMKLFNTSLIAFACIIAVIFRNELL